MTWDDIVHWGATALGFGLILLLVWVVGGVGRAVYVDSRCLELGWRTGLLNWKLEGYCTRQENEYDITRPLKELEAEN